MITLKNCITVLRRLCITVRRRAIALTYYFEAAGSRRPVGIMVSGAACVVCCVVHEVFLCVCVLHVLFGVVYKVTLKFFE
jgi:hypothetical protein